MVLTVSATSIASSFLYKEYALTNSSIVLALDADVTERLHLDNQVRVYSKKDAGISKTISSCKAVSGVIAVLPLIISLIVFRGLPIRWANSAWLMPFSSSVSSSVIPGLSRKIG